MTPEQIQRFDDEFSAYEFIHENVTKDEIKAFITQLLQEERNELRGKIEGLRMSHCSSLNTTPSQRMCHNHAIDDVLALLPQKEVGN